MNAYRESAAPPLEPVVATPRGLVRRNGSRCTCTPPGLLWCWWYSVEPGDAWLCKHGGGWDRIDSYGTREMRDFWRATEKGSISE